jgi:3,4-dihydroxy 2-butanone 4-phosphate synthase/GTP cyclohydrolase II
MAISSIDDILADIKIGKPIIMIDDENRENEGDIIVAAEKTTPEIIAFMIKEARGLLCLSLTQAQCENLNLKPMVAAPENGSKFKTAFMTSIEAAEGITTGISAHDRATTILVASNLNSTAKDIMQPGHIFPVMAKPGGVLERGGHTEAGCDLTRLAGLTPAAAIIEVINDDGSMSRTKDLEVFAKKHGLKIGTIEDLIKYRTKNNC